MSYSVAGIIFSSLNNNTLSRLTSDRTVAAIPFACRYRLIDFALSNLVNSNISNINIISNYNYRSLLEHIGSGKDWDLARHSGGINIISPYQTSNSSNAKMFTTRMEALINMKEYIDEFREEYVVLMDSDSILNIDINEVVKSHVESGAKITAVTCVPNEEYTSKHNRMMVNTDKGKIINISMTNRFSYTNPELVLNIFVMTTVYLRKIIDNAVSYNIKSLTSIIMQSYNKENFYTYCYSGYVATVSSFLDYYKHSMELATDESARNILLNNKKAPIYTRIHNSSPVIYRSGAKVESSIIADECVIEGEVINSIVFRNVHIQRGAVIKDSILFSGTYVSKNAKLNCIVTDKDVFISEGINLSGNKNMPFYISKKRRV